jgi:hypothetical protein
MDYDPNLLDDPQWPCGKHKRVLIFPSYMVSSVRWMDGWMDGWMDKWFAPLHSHLGQPEKGLLVFTD